MSACVFGVRLCVRMHAIKCMCVKRTLAQLHICIDACSHIHTCVRALVCVRACVYVQVSICVYVCTRMGVHVCVCAHACIV